MVEIHVGDVVVVNDHSIPEKPWDKGRGVIPNAAGVVRAVYPGGLVDVQISQTTVPWTHLQTDAALADGKTFTRVPYRESPTHAPSWQKIE